jgi:hypothetical protein
MFFTYDVVPIVPSGDMRIKFALLRCGNFRSREERVVRTVGGTSRIQH